MQLVQGIMFGMTMIYTLVVVVPTGPDCSTSCPLEVIASEYTCETRLRSLGGVDADAPFGAGGNATTLAKFSSGCLDCSEPDSWDILRPCPGSVSRLQSCEGAGSGGARLAASGCVDTLSSADPSELQPSLFSLGPGQGAETRFDGGTCIAFLAEDVLVRPLARPSDLFFNQSLAQRGEGPGVVLAFREEAQTGGLSSQ